MYAKTYFQSINELPYGRWLRAHNGDLSAIRKKTFGTGKGDAIHFEKLINEYIRIFGLGDSFMTIWNKKKELAELNQKYLSDFINNRYLLTEIEQLEKEIEQLQNESSNGNMLDVIVQLRKINNITIDLDKDSVVFVERLIRAN